VGFFEGKGVVGFIEGACVDGAGDGLIVGRLLVGNRVGMVVGLVAGQLVLHIR
jgi:hypothetical protein